MRDGRPLLAGLAIAALAAGCGDDEESPEGPTATAPRSIDERPQSPPSQESAPNVEKRRHARRNSTLDEQRKAARTVRDYVRALDDRDGAAVCALLVPGAIDEVDLPRERAGCAASLSASIGYRDPRGLPVWETARVGDVLSAEVDGETAKVVATTITLFADREEPSIEDDVVYLVRRDGRWLLAKPSSTLYRAVGIADIPPSVLAAP